MRVSKKALSSLAPLRRRRLSRLVSLAASVQGNLPLGNALGVQQGPEVVIELVSAKTVGGPAVPPDALPQRSVPPLIVHCVVASIGSVLLVLKVRPQQGQSTLLEEVYGR